jgi:hypothetical protein
MTTHDATPNPRGNVEDQAIAPGEIEGLLPWYAAGSLRRRDRRRVEMALRDDADLMRQADLVREELAETIRLNETLGVPSSRVMDRVMAAIDAEDVAARKRASARTIAGRFTSFIASFSPRTLAVAASVAVLAIGLQAFALLGLLSKPQGFSQSAATSETQGHGAFAMVRFTRQANAGEITRFLEDYQATLVDGPKPGGLYRIKVAAKSLAKGELGRILGRMKQEHVVEFAGPSE